jgi:Anti-anti-sigma regulatory factor (antagonist of anti-sigma factor)
MEVKLLLDGDITVISLSGRIDIDKTQAFKSACLQNFTHKKVVFCLKNLNFVGSTGIQSFFGVLNDLKATKEIDVRISGLNHDFQRLFQFASCPELEMHQDIENAIQSYGV